jgi:hypothetical protein
MSNQHYAIASLPLVSALCMTAYKFQGMTQARMIFTLPSDAASTNVNANERTTAGGRGSSRRAVGKPIVYTACSRTKAAEGLFLTSPLPSYLDNNGNVRLMYQRRTEIDHMMDELISSSRHASLPSTSPSSSPSTMVGTCLLPPPAVSSAAASSSNATSTPPLSYLAFPQQDGGQEVQQPPQHQQTQQQPQTLQRQQLQPQGRSRQQQQEAQQQVEEKQQLRRLQRQRPLLEPNATHSAYMCPPIADAFGVPMRGVVEHHANYIRFEFAARYEELLSALRRAVQAGVPWKDGVLRSTRDVTNSSDGDCHWPAELQNRLFDALPIGDDPLTGIAHVFFQFVLEHKNPNNGNPSTRWR